MVLLFSASTEVYVHLHIYRLDNHRRCGFFFPVKPPFVGTRFNSTHFVIGQPHIVCVWMCKNECDVEPGLWANNYYRKITERFSTFLAFELLNAAILVLIIFVLFPSILYYCSSTTQTICRFLFLCILLLMMIFSVYVCAFLCLCIFTTDRCAHSITFQTQQMNSGNEKKTV